MFAANVRGLRTLCPDLAITAVSREPEWTAHRYGIQAIGAVGFPAFEQAETDRRNLWGQMIEGVEKLRAGKPLNGGRGAAVIRAVSCADAVIVSGGGNLRSAHAEHIYERMALIHTAIETGKPVLVLGQTVGPDLEPAHAELLAHYLKAAALVGVRESDSAALVASLGIEEDRILRQLDDAWFLRPDASEGLPKGVASTGGPPWIAVTLAPWPALYAREDAIRSLADQLSTVMGETGANLIFIPHWNAVGNTASDTTIARSVIDLLEEPWRAKLLPVHTAEAICWMTRQAAMVITNRYHPTVFALSGGVPCLSIYSDEYTRVRQTGALSQAHMQRYAMELESCLRGDLASAALALWRDREDVKQHLLSFVPGWQEMEADKWSCVASVLGWPEGESVLRIPGADELLQTPNRDIAESEGVSQSQFAIATKPAVAEGPLANVSVVILSKNGADRLERCLESIAKFDFGEIVVCVDDTITDRYMSVARQFTDRVHLLKTPGFIEPVLSTMASLCSKAYVLRIDDDEVLSGNWDGQRIESLSRFNYITHYYVPRRWLVSPGDRFLADEPWFPDTQLRLFRNDPSLITWPAEIHDPMRVEGRGLVLTDRWIDHYDAVDRSREEREAKCRHYLALRPAKHMSYFYLWEDAEADLLPADSAGFYRAMERALPAAQQKAILSFETYTLGSEIRFEAGGNSEAFRRGDWSKPEDWGTWTEGHRVVLSLPLDRAPTTSLELTVAAKAFLIPGSHPNLRAWVVCGSTILTEWVLDSAGIQELNLRIPAELITRNNPFTVAFHILNPVSPKELGLSEDDRPLGLGFQCVRLGMPADE